MVACMVYFPTWKPIKLNHPWIGKYTRQSWIRKMGFLTTTHRHLSPKKKNIVGGFKPPLWKICDRQNGWTSSPNFRGEHEKYLKPPTQKNIGTPAKKRSPPFIDLTDGLFTPLHPGDVDGRCFRRFFRFPESRKSSGWGWAWLGILKLGAVPFGWVVFFGTSPEISPYPRVINNSPSVSRVALIP